MAKLLSGLSVKGAFGDRGSVANVLNEPNTFAELSFTPTMLSRQERDKLAGFFVDVDVNGFVADGESWFIDFQSSADLFGRPAEFYFFVEVGVDFRMS